MSDRIALTPELVRGTDLYLIVQQRGPGAIATLAVDLLCHWYAEADKVVMPEGFVAIGTRDVLVNGKETETYRVFRFYWQPPRHVLLPGIREPLVEKPIIFNWSDLVRRCIGLQVTSDDGPSETVFYQAAQTNDRLIPMTLGQLSVVPGSDVPWYRARYL